MEVRKKKKGKEEKRGGQPGVGDAGQIYPLVWRWCRVLGRKRHSSCCSAGCVLRCPLPTGHLRLALRRGAFTTTGAGAEWYLPNNARSIARRPNTNRRATGLQGAARWGSICSSLPRRERRDTTRRRSLSNGSRSDDPPRWVSFWAVLLHARRNQKVACRRQRGRGMDKALAQGGGCAETPP